MPLVSRTSFLALALVLTGAPARADLNCNVGIEFHLDGGVKACTLNGVHALYTESGTLVRCADGARAELHEDGSLRACTLVAEVRVAGRACAAGERIELARDGTIARCGEDASP